MICEWDSVQKENRQFQLAMLKLEQATVNKCLADWKPKTFNINKTLSPSADGFGRTTILPALFDDHTGNQMYYDPDPAAVAPFNDPQQATWRQLFTTAEHQTLITGRGSGNTIPEDFKVAWIGLALPNEQQHITEIKFQIGDRKYGRLNLEEIHSYNKPAIIFEEGFILNQEESFELYGYVEGPIPTHYGAYTGVHQRIVMLGATYFKVISKVLGNCGAAI